MALVQDEVSKQFAVTVKEECFWLLPSETEAYQLTSSKLDFFPGYTLSMLKIPESYSDKYFLHSKDITEAEVLTSLLDGSNQHIYNIAKEKIPDWVGFSREEQIRIAKAYAFFLRYCSGKHGQVLLGRINRRYPMA